MTITAYPRNPVQSPTVSVRLGDGTILDNCPVLGLESRRFPLILIELHGSQFTVEVSQQTARNAIEEGFPIRV